MTFEKLDAIKEQEIEPLGADMIDYLMSQKNELSVLDFKWKMDIGKNSDFPKIVKDVFAFTNYGGGFIVFGIKQNDRKDEKIKGRFVFEGLPDDFEIDQATIQEKVNAYMESPVVIDYVEFYKEINNQLKKFAIIYIPHSLKVTTPIKDGTYQVGDKKIKAFSIGDIFTRRGTQSILASPWEQKLIIKRIEEDNYKISILSGDPDKVEEVLYSNLFEVKSIPKQVYIAPAKFDSIKEDKECLKLTYPGKIHFIPKYTRYENNLVTFQNIKDPTNYFRNLVNSNEIKQEPIDLWMDGGPKEKIIVSLLNKEIAGNGVNHQMEFHPFTKKLFYSTESDSKEVSWPTRFKGVSNKVVATKIWAPSLKKFVFIHAAVKCSIIKIQEKFFLKMYITHIITEDGKRVTKGLKEGAIITQHSHNTFNKQYLNNILFWINKLGDGMEIKILDDLIISVNPVRTTLDHGISWDMPPSEIKTFIEEYEDDVAEVEEGDDEIGGELFV